MRVPLMSHSDHRAAWVAAACCAAAMSISASPASAAPERRGGIEIGAKGVKATVVELGGGPGAPAVKQLMSRVANTTIAAGVVQNERYGDAAIRETAAEAGKFAKQMRDEFGVPPGNIRVIGSSGLPQASNRAALVDAVKAATGLAPMEFITPCREVELNVLGLIPERKDAVLVDVGSGSTKGGLIDSGGQPVCFSVPFGSVTFANRVTKEAAGKPFPEAASQLRPMLLQAPLDEQIRAHPDLAARPVVFLVGGAPYAMATLTHPEAALQDRVTLTDKDIADYAARLRAGQGIPKPDLASITDPAVRAKAEQEVQNVGDTFTRDNLIAGAEILTTLSAALKFEGKTLVFDRSGVTAWIRASLTTPAPKPPAAASPTATRPGAAPTLPVGVKPAPLAAPMPPVYPSPQSPPIGA